MRDQECRKRRPLSGGREDETNGYGELCERQHHRGRPGEAFADTKLLQRLPRALQIAQLADAEANDRARLDIADSIGCVGQHEVGQ